MPEFIKHLQHFDIIRDFFHFIFERKINHCPFRNCVNLLCPLIFTSNIKLDKQLHSLKSFLKINILFSMKINTFFKIESTTFNKKKHLWEHGDST